jgi:hypothetical protein
VLCSWQPLSYRVGVIECPDGYLLQHADLGEDIEVGEFVGLLVGAERVAIGRFCNKLAAGVLVEYLQAAMMLAWSEKG